MRRTKPIMIRQVRLPFYKQPPACCSRPVCSPKLTGFTCERTIMKSPGLGRPGLNGQKAGQLRLTTCQVLLRYRDADNGGAIAEICSAKDLH